MKIQFARREFLRRAGLATGSLVGGSILFDAVVGELVNKAMAQATGTTTPASGPYYIHMSFPGAPPRWLFDLPLTPFGNPTSTNFVQGKFGTLFEAAPAVGFAPVYAVKPFKVGTQTLYLAPVWDMSVAGQDFTSLLPNTLFVRGMDMQVNSHPLSNQMQVSPIIGGYSMTGVVSDQSTLPIPAIIDPSVPASNVYRSHKGYSPTPINYTSNSVTNPAMTLLGPFQNFFTSRQVSSAAVAPSQQAALQAFEQYATNQGFSPNVLAEMYDNAVQLIEGNIFSLSNNWNQVYTKYASIISEALAPGFSYTGLTDQAIPATSDPSFNMQTAGAIGVPMTTGFDLRNIISSTTVPTNMAANFAIAEMMLGQLSSSFCLGFAPLTNMAGCSTGTPLNMVHDQHFTGSAMATMGNTFFYRCFLGCLTAFVSQLKATNQFNNTVIHIGAEFSRTPKSASSGADHAYQGSGTTLISGMFSQPAVIGNVSIQTNSTAYPGTWGLAANYPLDGFTRPIQQNDVARQISLMLGVADIVTNGMVLLQKNSDGTWTPRTGASLGANNV